MRPSFNRILLKLSGEALMGDLPYGTDAEQVQAIAEQVRGARARGVEVALVVGAGNIYRGLQGAAKGMDRATGDYMGMLATVLNSLTLQDALEKLGEHTRVMSAIDVKEVALLDQPHVNTDKHEGKTIEEMRQELAAKTGENVRVARFAYFRVGEE